MNNIQILLDIAKTPLGISRKELQERYFDNSRFKASGYIDWLLYNKMVVKLGHNYCATMNLITYLDILLKSPIVESEQVNEATIKTGTKEEQKGNKTGTKQEQVNEATIKTYWQGYLCNNPETQEYKDKNKYITENDLKNIFIRDCKFCCPQVEESILKKFGAYWFERLKNGKYRFQVEKAFELNQKLYFFGDR